MATAVLTSWRLEAPARRQVITCAGRGTAQHRAELRRKARKEFKGFHVLLRRAVLDLMTLGENARELDMDKGVISQAKELGRIAAISEWFRFVAFVMASADILPVVNELSGKSASADQFTAAIIGGLVGLHFAAINAIAKRKLWREPQKPLRVVITGSTRGLGKAIAREFLRTGDKVYITSSSPKGVRAALKEIRSDLKRWGMDERMVMGESCDISKPAEITRLVSLACDQLGKVDIWVNCAGFSGSFMEFESMPAETISQIVATNLLGSMLCTRNAIRLMMCQPEGGHIFNTEGAGSDFAATPNYAAYGATKAAITQFSTSLHQEMKDSNPIVGVHTIQPGMVLTKLLLEGATVRNKQFFNILCEQPETVAAFLVPRMRTVVARKSRFTNITYLTFARATARILTAPSRFGRFFDKFGRKVYPCEQDRLHGPMSKATARQAQDARNRSKHLAALYSLCMSFCFVWMAISDASV